jgi:hypothetical protein
MIPGQESCPKRNGSVRLAPIDGVDVHRYRGVAPTTGRKTLRLDIGNVREDLFWMSRGVHVRVCLLDVTVRVDPIADALGMLRAFLVACAVRQAYRARGIAQEREVEVELLRERAILLSGIETDAENLDVLIGVLLNFVAEPATFLGSPRGIGFGIEPQNDVVALEIGESKRVPQVVLEFERGRRLSGLDHGELLRDSWIRCDRMERKRTLPFRLGGERAHEWSRHRRR